MIEKEATGIFHIGCDEFVSRYELAVRIAKHFGLDSDLIEPISADSIPRKAKRPAVAGLNCDKTSEFLGIKMPSLADELRAISA